MKKPIALITGISGQTGSYLAEHLLSLGYEVHGIVRRSSLIKTDRIDHIFDRIHLHYGDLTDGMNLMRLVSEIRPAEIYNLGAQSHVAVSFETPEYTANCDALGTLRLLEVIRAIDPSIKFYQASTSELYGYSKSPQSETTMFQPCSPYAEQSCMPIGSPKTIAVVMDCMQSMVFCSITKVHDEAKPL